jgi:hypothetical protein
MGHLHGAILPVTQIARVLSNRGFSPRIFNTAQLVAEMEKTLEDHRAFSQ